MPAKFDRCVRKVRAQGGVRNPFAVCRAQLGSDAEIRAREKRKRGRKRA